MHSQHLNQRFGRGRGKELTPKMEKSIAITTKVKIQAKAATEAPRSDPTTPAPRLKRKAIKDRAQAMGWRTIARVKPSTVSDAELLKWVPVQSISIRFLAKGGEE